MKTVVIIGGGPSGRVITHALKKLAPTKFKTITIKDEPINANRCAIPYGIDPNKKFQKYLIPNKLITNFGELIVGKAISVDSSKKEVEFNRFTWDEKTGKILNRNESKLETIKYDYLVIGTGSSPRKLTGIKNLYSTPFVTHFRGGNDLEKIRNWIKNGAKSCTVIGGGYIGIEVAEQCKELGLETTILQRSAHILRTHVEPEFYQQLEDEVKKHGIKIKFHTQIKEVIQNDNGSIQQIVLNTGESMKTDFIVVSCGVKPNTNIKFKDNKQQPLIGKFGYQINKFCQLRKKDGNQFNSIFASGDVAQNNIYGLGEGHSVDSGFGTNAVFMSRIIAKNIIFIDNKNDSSCVEWKGVMNGACSTIFSLSFGRVGMSESTAKRFNIPVVCGYSECNDKYPQLNPNIIRTKLVFRKDTKELIGGSVVRPGIATAGNLDFISLGIQMKTKIKDVLNFQYSTQPILAAKPSDNLFFFAARDALQNLKKCK